jgi:predicted ATP-grasp superfamily ATP-dependent carboligase
MRSNKQDRILILGGESRAALAGIRSFARLGHAVDIISHQKRSICSVSKHIKNQVVSPNPNTDFDEFQQWLMRLVARSKPTMIIPTTNAMLFHTMELDDRLRENAILPMSRKDITLKLLDKNYVRELANNLGIDTPRSTLLTGKSPRSVSLNESLHSFPFPAVIKPQLSTFKMDGELYNCKANFVDSKEDVLKEFELSPPNGLKGALCLLQERIQGTSVVVCALAAQGELLTHFTYERLLEKPPSGGSTVLAESIATDSKLIAQVRELLNSLSWTGVVAIEFIRTPAPESKHYLINIIPRFWDSMSHATACGRDFPALLYSLASISTSEALDQFKQSTKALPEYVVGKRYRWLVGTIDHALLRVFDERLPAMKSIFLQNSLRLLQSKGTVNDTWQWGDSRPFFIELEHWLTDLV